jgi:hypothetical protein
VRASASRRRPKIILAPDVARALPVDALGVTEAAEPRRRVLVTVAGAILLLGAVLAVVVWDPVGGLVRAVDLSELVWLSDTPDVPRWLLWALGKLKFVVVAVAVLVVVVREQRRRRAA